MIKLWKERRESMALFDDLTKSGKVYGKNN